MKINLRNQLSIEFKDYILTQPNQAFTPRQIIEQFARHEIVPTMNESSDLLDEVNYSEETLLESDVIEFDDPMEAAFYLNDNQFSLQNETGGNVSEGSNGASDGIEPSAGSTDSNS